MLLISFVKQVHGQGMCYPIFLQKSKYIQEYIFFQVLTLAIFLCLVIVLAQVGCVLSTRNYILQKCFQNISFILCLCTLYGPSQFFVSFPWWLFFPPMSTLHKTKSSFLKAQGITFLLYLVAIFLFSSISLTMTISLFSPMRSSSVKFPSF